MKQFSLRRVIAMLLVMAMVLPMFEVLGPFTFAAENEGGVTLPADNVYEKEPIVLIAGSDYFNK